MLTDVRNALRALRAAPSFTMVALLILTLGIGVSTAIFSVVDAVVLRGLPFDDADRLVSVSQGVLAPEQGPAAQAPQNSLDWRAGQRVFDRRGDQHGRLVRMREQTPHHLVADEDVKAAQRLIEHKQGGPVRQGRSQAHSPGPVDELPERGATWMFSDNEKDSAWKQRWKNGVFLKWWVKNETRMRSCRGLCWSR